MNRIHPLCERQTGFGTLGTFNVGRIHVVFPLAVTGQLIVDLSFAFQADTGIGGVAAAGVAIGGPDVLNHFP
jgi:hypothetical protein